VFANKLSFVLSQNILCIIRHSVHHNIADSVVTCCLPCTVYLLKTSQGWGWWHFIPAPSSLVTWCDSRWQHSCCNVTAPTGVTLVLFAAGEARLSSSKTATTETKRSGFLPESCETGLMTLWPCVVTIRKDHSTHRLITQHSCFSIS